MRTGTIYALLEPDGTPRYIGKTVQNPGSRYGEHIREATRRFRTSPVHYWLRRLVRFDLRPGLLILESGIPIHRLNQRERRWIRSYTQAGYGLLNYTGGGNGASTMSERRRKAQSLQAARQGRDLDGRFLPITAEDW
jgi:hypothetical protein